MKPIFIVSTVLLTTSAFASSFKCDLKNPKTEIKSVQGCSDNVVWNYELDAIRKVDPAKFDAMVAKQVTQDTNFGGTRLSFGGKKEKLLYRSSFLTESKACMENLVSQQKVTTIINLYSGEIENNIKMTQEETSMFQKAGGKQYLRVLNYDYRMADEEAKKQIYDKVREVVSLIRQAPDNVLIHCYGGQHRTGIVYGIIQKCVNRQPIEKVIDEYRCHTAYENENKRGGAKEENERAIREFPCNSLALK